MFVPCLLHKFVTLKSFFVSMQLEGSQADLVGTNINSIHKTHTQFEALFSTKPNHNKPKQDLVGSVCIPASQVLTMAALHRKGPGGAHNRPKPNIDEDVMWKLFSSHEDWVDLGPYETLSRSQACNGEAIAGMYGFVKAILKVAPTGAFAAAPAKAALCRIVTANPKLNTTGFNSFVFVGVRIERITTMMFHLRRISTNHKHFAACAAKCTPGGLQRLQDLTHLMDTSLADQESTCSNYYDSQPSERGLATLGSHGFPLALTDRLEIPETECSPEETPAKRRKLKAQHLDVSVDSDGWPTVLCENFSSAQPTVPKSSRLASLKGSPQGEDKAAGKAILQPKNSSKPRATPTSKASSSNCKVQTQPHDAEEQEFPVYLNCWTACYAKDQSGALPSVFCFGFQASQFEGWFLKGACVFVLVLVFVLF